MYIVLTASLPRFFLPYLLTIEDGVKRSWFLQYAAVVTWSTAGILYVAVYAVYVSIIPVVVPGGVAFMGVVAFKKAEK